MEDESMDSIWSDISEEKSTSPHEEEEPAYAAEVAEEASSRFEDFARELGYESHYDLIPGFDGEREDRHEQQQHQVENEAENEWTYIVVTESDLDTQTLSIPDELEEPRWGYEEDQQRIERTTYIVSKKIHQEETGESWPQSTILPDFQAAKKKKKHKTPSSSSIASSTSPSPPPIVVANTSAPTPVQQVKAQSPQPAPTPQQMGAAMPTTTAVAASPKPHRGGGVQTSIIPPGTASTAPVANMPPYGGLNQDLGGLGQIGVFTDSSANHIHCMNSFMFASIFVFAYLYAHN